MANLLPAKTKYRKVHKGRNRGIAKGCNTIAFGEFAIQSLELGRVTASQLEATRVAITRNQKRKGKVWMRIFPHKSVTKKPAETRMGKGKGAVEYWCAPVKPGTILFEVSGVTPSVAREGFKLADSKLPFRCRFVSREELDQY